VTAPGGAGEGPVPPDPAPPGAAPSGAAPRASAPPLARTTLDRAAHHRRDQRWLDDAWSRAQVVVVDVRGGGRALVRDRAAGAPELVLLDGPSAPPVAPDGRLFLGVEPDGAPVFAVDATLPDMPDTRPVTLRDVGHVLSDRDAGLFTAAVALANWHTSHLYSPLTGHPTTVADGGWTRVDAGGKQMWPRTDPAMIVLVHDGVAGTGGRCLLGRNAAWPMTGAVRRFSCLAGFVEPGESAEAAVVREVAEEVGVRVDDLRYEGSQAWPFPGSLMLGFTARADPAQPVRVDPEEIVEARWFTRAEVGEMVRAGFLDARDGVRVGLPMPASIAFFLVERWLYRPDR
jgi:NAD+ diphosphatase